MRKSVLIIALCALYMSCAKENAISIRHVYYDYPDFFAAIRDTSGNIITKNQAAFTRGHLNEQQTRLYNEAAGTYITHDISSRYIQKYYLQIYSRPWEEFSWGKDKSLDFWNHGILDYSLDFNEFVIKTDDSGLRPLSALSLSDPNYDAAFTVAAWLRTSSPSKPREFLQELAQTEEAQYQTYKDRLIEPRRAYKLIRNTFLSLMASWRDGALADQLAFISYDGLSVDNYPYIANAWHWPYGFLKEKSVNGEETLLYDGRLESQARALFDYMKEVDVYSNLIMNDDIEILFRQYNNPIVLDLVPYIGTGRNAIPTEDRLSLYFVEEDGIWKIREISFWVDISRELKAVHSADPY